MKVVVAVINDGRDQYLEATLKSFKAKVHFDEPPHIQIFCDGDAGIALRAHSVALACGVDAGVTSLSDDGKAIGVYAMVYRAWRHLQAECPDCRFIYHQENDFIYNEDVSVPELAAILEENPLACQVVLKRQPWSKGEKARGNIYDRAYCDEVVTVEGQRFVRQARWFSFNPCLYRKSDMLLHDGAMTEKQLMSDFRAAHRYSLYLGGWDDPPVVHHIGEMSIKKDKH